MSSIIKRITARAKSIRKGTGMKWLTALKKAGAELRGKKATRKKSSKSKTKTRVKRLAPAVDNFRPGLATAKSEYRKAIEDNLSKLLLRKELTPGKRDKRKIQKQINEVRSDLRHVRN